MLTGQPSEDAEDKSPEKEAEYQSPEDHFSRRCRYRRTDPEDPFDKCECGIDFWDRSASDIRKCGVYGILEDPVPEGSPARVSPGEESLSEGQPSDEDEEEDEDKCQEAETSELDQWDDLDEFCRRCACRCIETLDTCKQCGVAFADRQWGKIDRDLTTLKVNMMQMFSGDELGLQPLIIDPESGCPEPLALNMAWKDETDPE